MSSKGFADRQVLNLPKWYKEEACPYKSTSFSPEVLDYMNKQTSNGINRLRMGKCILVGDFDIGKTSLIHKFAFDAFVNNRIPTIGVDFRIQKFTMLNSHYQLNIWDTAGQERYKSITTSFYRNSHVILLVFDMSRIATLGNIRTWYEQVMSIVVQKEVQKLKHEFTEGVRKSIDTAKIPENRFVVEPFVFLVGTKMDQISASAFEFVEQEAIKIAQEIRAEYWSVSALTGNNVNQLFTRVAALSFQEVIFRELDKEKEEKEDAARALAAQEILKLDAKPKKRRSLKCIRFKLKIPKKIKNLTEHLLKLRGSNSSSGTSSPSSTSQIKSINKT